MISYKHRFIYLRIPKCASTTLRECFSRGAAGFDIGLREHFVPRWLEKDGQVPLISLHPDYFVFSW